MTSATRLSKLQREILAMAADRWRNPAPRIHERQDEASRRRVLHREFLTKLFGLEPDWNLRPGEVGRAFSMKRVGIASYRAAHASLSRALARLESRGLLVRFMGMAYSAATATPAGVAAAERVKETVNRVSQCNCDNRCTAGGTA